MVNGESNQSKIYVVSIKDAVDDFLKDDAVTKRPAFMQEPTITDEAYIDVLLDYMLCHFEYKEEALNGFSDHCITVIEGDKPSHVFFEQEREAEWLTEEERFLYVQALMKFARAVFDVLVDNGLYDESGELRGSYTVRHDTTLFIEAAHDGNT